MSCVICQIPTEFQCEFHMISFCSDHLDSHLSDPQNNACKSISALNYINEKKNSAKNLKKQKQEELIEKGILFFRDTNVLDIEEKKLYMDSIDNKDFDEVFGLEDEDRDYIKNIYFSNDKTLSFVCIKYSGKKN